MGSEQPGGDRRRDPLIVVKFNREGEWLAELDKSLLTTPVRLTLEYRYLPPDQMLAMVSLLAGFINDMGQLVELRDHVANLMPAVDEAEKKALLQDRLRKLRRELELRCLDVRQGWYDVT